MAHIIPDSTYIRRGKNSISDLLLHAQEKKIDHILIVTSKKGYVNQINLYENKKDGFEQDPYFLRIFEFLDPRMFNQEKLNHRGPLSTSLETRSENPELVDLLDKYFLIDFSVKQKLWLMLDNKEHSTYLAIFDSVTMSRISMIKLQVKKRT